MTAQAETHATIARRPSTGARRALLVWRQAGLLLILGASFLAAPAAAQQNELISINAAGTAAGNGNSGIVLGTMGPRASADGRFVVFESNATDLIPGGTTVGRVNVYLRDRLDSMTTLISHNASGTLNANGNSFSPSITPNGRFIVFLSNASNLVTLPDSNGSLLDIFRYDTCFGAAAGCTTAMELVSVNSAGTASGNNRVSIGNFEVNPHPLRTFVVKDDGNRILFASRATDLVTGFVDGNASGGADLYVRDMSLGQTFLITPNAAGTASSNSRHGSFDMNPTGTAFVFHSSSTDLTGQADTTVIDIFFRSLSGMTLGPATNLTAGFNDTTTAVGLGEGPPGTFFVIGHTFATNHVLPEGNGNNPDLILLNPQTLQRTLITTKFDGSATANAGTTGIEKLVLTGGTTYLLGFTTTATDIINVPLPPNVAQEYLALIVDGSPAGPVQLSSTASDGSPANADVVEQTPFIFPNTSVAGVVLGTRATNLIGDIVKGTKVQLFVVDVAGNGVLLTKGQGGQSGDGDASLPFVSFDPATLTTLITHVNNSTNLTSVPNPAGNLNVFTSAIPSSAPDLVIAKFDSTPFVDFMVGAQAFYEIVVTNIATNFRPPFSTTDVITVTDNLPAGLTFVSGSGSGWMCTANGQMVTCTHPGPVFQGTDLPLLTLTVNVGAAALPSVTNFASVFTAGDSNPQNDFSAPVVTPVQSAASPTVLVDANGDVRYNAPAGQINDITVTLAPTGQLVISDANNPVIPGNGFVQGATPNEVVSVGPAPNTGGSFNLNDGDDRFLDQTSSFSTLTVDSGPGDDFVGFAPTTAATINLTDPAGSNQATFNGPGNATTFDISDLRLTYGPLTANYSGFQRAIVLGNGAADIFNVRLDGAPAVPFTLILDGKGSDDAYNLQLGGFGNTVNINDSGSTTGDTLTVSQNEGGTMELNSNSLIFSNDLASYTGIERVNAVGSPFDDNFFYRVPLLPGTLDGGGGTNGARFEGDFLNNTITIVVQAVDADGNRISFVNIIEIEAQMGGGDDTVTVMPSPTTAINADGGADTDTLTVETLGQPFTEVGNVITVSGSQPVTHMNFESVTVGTSLSADVAVALTDMPDPAAVGGNVTYTAVVSNGGPSIATGVSLDITLPGMTTFGSVMTTKGTCGMPMGLQLNCPIGTLAPGESATVTVVLTPTATGMFTLDANVTSGVPDPNPPNNHDSETTTANPSAEVSVTKANSPDPVNPGANLTSTIIVRNNGPSPATGVTVVDTLPFGALFSSAMTTQGVCAGPAPAGFDVTCNIAAIPSGGMVTITVVTNIQGAVTGTLTNNVTVTAAEPDPNPANNMASATTNIAAIADLSITKTDSPDPVTFGSNITYTITVTNNGPSMATNVSISDTLPLTGLTFVSAMLSPSGSCQFASGVITCNVGVMSSVTSATATFIVTPTVTGSVANTATVSSNVPDQNTANNSATAVTMVNPPAAPTGINVSASPSSRTVAPGQAATFNITIGAMPAGAAFNAPVTFNGMANPPGAIIAFSPNPAPPGSTTANTTMTVLVPRNSAMLPGAPSPLLPGLVLSWLALALVTVGAMASRTRQRRLAYCLPVGLLFLLLTLGGCAQSSAVGTTGPVTVTVTATSGNMSQSTTVTLNVVP